MKDSEGQRLTESEIYRIFTRDRGIPLSNSVIKYIQQLFTINTLEIYVDLIKQEYTTGILTHKEIDEALSKKIQQKEKIEVIKVKFKPGGIERYKTLKESVLLQKISIAALKIGVPAVIFGMVRVSEDGLVEIEDENESVRVVSVEESKYFLCTGVCAGFEGELQKSGFLVKKIHLPKKRKTKINHLKKNCNFIFISKFSSKPENVKKLQKILKVYKEYNIDISAVIISLRETESLPNISSSLQNILKEHKNIEFIIIPNINNYFYPFNNFTTENNPHQHKNLKIGSNPVKIKIFNLIFLIGDFDLLDGIKNESILKGEFREELSKVFLSQDSFNPFIPYADLSYTDYYTGIIIGDKYDSYSYKENEQLFSICGDFEKSEGQFLFFNGEELDFEICSVGDMSEV